MNVFLQVGWIVATVMLVLAFLLVLPLVLVVDKVRQRRRINVIILRLVVWCDGLIATLCLANVMNEAFSGKWIWTFYWAAVGGLALFFNRRAYEDYRRHLTRHPG